jgi:predicted lipid-binding transport protein (Tim44 family)
MGIDMLRKLLSVLLVILMVGGLLVQNAEARRFGGGRSFGLSRSASSFSAPRMGQNAYRSQQPGAASPMGRWLGPLAGLAVGGLLASLFMSNGIGSGILSWLLVGGLFLVLLSLIRNKRHQPNPIYRDDYKNSFSSENVNPFARQANRNNDRTYASASNVFPIGFDAPTFLRDAKAQYIRLQAAYDQKNLNDIREFTSPEVFAEIQLQFQERGIAENITDVISLEAELLNIENESQHIAGTEMQGMLATVRFNGMIQEDRALAAAEVSEIWHFRRDVGSLRWIVAGVQQA